MGIEILSATYGNNCSTTDRNCTGNDKPTNTSSPCVFQTYNIKRKCEGKDVCSFTVDVNQIGDPARGCQKTFEVEYRCPNTKANIKHTVDKEANGQRITLNCE